MVVSILTAGRRHVSKDTRKSSQASVAAASGVDAGTSLRQSALGSIDSFARRLCRAHRGFVADDRRGAANGYRPPTWRFASYRHQHDHAAPAWSTGNSPPLPWGVPHAEGRRTG